MPLAGGQELWGVALVGPAADGSGEGLSHFQDGLAWLWREARNHQPACVLRASPEWRRWSAPGLPSRLQQTGDVLFLLRLASMHLMHKVSRNAAKFDKAAALAAAALFYVLHGQVGQLAGKEAAAALARADSLAISIGWFDFLLGDGGGAPCLSVPR